MKRLELWTGEKTYITPIGTIQTPEFVAQKFPGTTVAGIAYVVETDAEGVVALSEPMSLALLKSQHDLDSNLSVAEAISALEEIMNAPEPSGTYYTDETRIADALEDLVVLQMPEVQE